MTNTKNDIDILTEDSGAGFEIYEKETATIYDIYLPDVISRDDNYNELIQFLRELKDYDRVNLFLANFGGDCHVGYQLAHAIRGSKAFIQIHATGPCQSMGAVLCLTGDDLVVYPGVFLMFHNVTMHDGGKGQELTSSLKNNMKYLVGSDEYFCMPFLDKRDINKLKKDQDLYFHADSVDLKKRIQRHFEIPKRERR